VVAAAVATKYHPDVSSSAVASRTPSSSKVTIKWFVGLGPGAGAAQVAAEDKFVTDYNATNTDGMTLVLDAVPTDSDASTTLATEIADGNAPDIVGPVGIGEFQGLELLFLDLDPEIARNRIVLDKYPPAILKLLRQVRSDPPQTVQAGLPYTVDPGFIFYDKDLFRKAGLPDLPAQPGQTYMGKAWDWNELASVAARLTLDSSGRDAAQSGFDDNAIKQFGIDFPGVDARVMASTFGSGSFVADDGKTMQVPLVWPDAFNWYYKAIWTSHIAPTDAEEAGSLLDHGDSIASGHVAMALSFPSKINGYGAAGNAAFAGWGMAVMPSWNGAVTSPVSENTFGILIESKHPDQAFDAMLAIESDPGLLTAYGGMPADPTLQPVWFNSEQAAQSVVFPGNDLDWSVPRTMEGYAADPSAEARLPECFGSTTDAYTMFFTNLRTTPGLNLATELINLQEDLQAAADMTCPFMSP
jgi:multiple sugar transport system substrate-binding protein